ncbi:MAG TPA: BamA/TamA family outer membrane protein [Ferruginibacter sp.]|nr:BamA/TamA family outer membrane protein [Ferruginibacter sp.]
MHLKIPDKIALHKLTACFLICSIFLSSCSWISFNIPRKHPKGKPFVFKNSIEVTGGNFTKDERATLKQRLNAQLDDSSRINTKDAWIFFHFIEHPPAYDSASANQSARNMEASMLHLGYYKSIADYRADTILHNGQQRMHIQYHVETGKPTLIDTFMYILRRPDLQQLALENAKESLIKIGNPVTKAAVLGEINRMVNLYRNNGYYKFSSEELIMRGDTTVAALTTITEDIFEQLRLLEEAKLARENPTIKLALVLNPPADSGRLKKYYIDDIYIMPDYHSGDKHTDNNLLTTLARKRDCDTCRVNFIVKYHKKLFRTGFLRRNLYVRKGDLYNQDNFYKTLNSFSRAGVWQGTNIQVVEKKDSTSRKDSLNKIDLVVQLVPGKRYGYEAGIEASYSAQSNANSVTAANAGNLLGLSGNVTFLDRNVRKEGISMSHSLRAGIELNFKPDSNNRKNIVNSNEISYSNTIIFPRLVFPLRKFNNNLPLYNTRTFINSKVGYINRINLFNLQSFNFAIGYDYNQRIKKSNNDPRNNMRWVFKPINIEFARLYNETDSFRRTLDENPFLRYSFNTSLVAGSSIGFQYQRVNSKHPNRQSGIKVNLEESGLLWGRFGFFEKYMRQFGKIDLEYLFTSTRSKSAFVYRTFLGVGIAAKKDTTLPFFKQYFGGGSSSMRGWPIRGIGRGSQPLTPYGQNKFNDRTGDIQFETNMEYRYTIAQIIPNSVILRGALFVDIGNVWNARNSKSAGGIDSTQFRFKNLYKEMGMAAGAGFRLDFNYVVLRFDLGFRFKRPEMSYVNDGWKVPSLSFNDVLPKLFSRGSNDQYKKWRYENFNMTIGINYPF